MPSRPLSTSKCQICEVYPSKYRCPACPTRYCSVPCFKQHKATSCEGATDEAGPSESPSRVAQVFEAVSSSLNPPPGDSNSKDSSTQPHSLRSLTSLLWPPEPDPSIYTDPLRRDDPKPLRHEELLRIATSPQLRHLLTASSLPTILKILDAIPSPHARSSSLSRLLGLDSESLANPASNTLASQRDSPPPLEDLLQALTGEKEERAVSDAEKGWWLGNQKSKEGRIWIGDEEKKIMRVFAGVVCQAIDGNSADEIAWGQGGLTWEV